MLTGSYFRAPGQLVIQNRISAWSNAYKSIVEVDYQIFLGLENLVISNDKCKYQ